MKYQEIISRLAFPGVKFEAKAFAGTVWGRKNSIMPGEKIFRNEPASSVSGFETGVTRKPRRSAKRWQENKAVDSTAGTLSAESRLLLDAILTEFRYLHAVDIAGEVKQILMLQNELITTASVDKYSNEIKVFLLLHDFVFIHSFGVIVNSNGMLLSSLGSLSAYETWVKNEEERFMQSIGKNFNYARVKMSDATTTQPESERYDYKNEVSFIFRVKEVMTLLKERCDIFFRKVMDWSLA